MQPLFYGFSNSISCYIFLIITIIYKEVENIARLCILAFCACFHRRYFLIANISTQLVSDNVCELIAILIQRSIQHQSMEIRRDKKDALKVLCEYLFLRNSRHSLQSFEWNTKFSIYYITWRKCRLFLHGFYVISDVICNGFSCVVLYTVSQTTWLIQDKC